MKRNILFIIIVIFIKIQFSYATIVMNNRVVIPHNIDRDASNSNLVVIAKINKIDKEAGIFKYDGLDVNRVKIKCEIIHSIMNESPDTIIFYHYTARMEPILNNIKLYSTKNEDNANLFPNLNSYGFVENKNYILYLKKDKNKYQLVNPEISHLPEFTDEIILKNKQKFDKSIGCLIELCLQKFYSDTFTDGLNYIINSQAFQNFYLPLYKKKILQKLDLLLLNENKKYQNKSINHFIKIINDMKLYRNNYHGNLLFEEIRDKKYDVHVISDIKNLRQYLLTREYKILFCNLIIKKYRRKNIIDIAKEEIKFYRN